MKAGDLVYLKSGSPKLTVIAVERDHVAVTWMDVDGIQHESFLPSVCLVPVA